MAGYMATMARQLLAAAAVIATTPTDRSAAYCLTTNGLGGHGADKRAAGLQLLCGFWGVALRQCGGSDVLLVRQRVRRTLQHRASCYQMPFAHSR